VKTYNVPVALTLRTNRSIEVEANSPEEAAQKAVKKGALNERHWGREVLRVDECYVEMEILNDEIKEE
jgi:hypothetical protein